jgi:di/tricarboxylate transporter
MTLPQSAVFGILAAMLVLFLWNRIRYDLVALLGLLAATLAGLVPAQEAFAGFGHPAVVTVAAVLVLSRGLMSAGIVDALARQLTRVGDRPPAQVATLTGLVALSSGFMNNVGALALLMPVAIWMSRQSGRSPSLLLMPLAFGSLIGGLVTLIGTPPNIIIALFREETGKPAFGMFDFTPVGAGVALAGLLFISLFGWRLTPRRESESNPDDLFEIENYISEIVIPESSTFVGQTLFHLTSAMEEETDAKVVGMVREENEATIVGMIRGERMIAAPSWYEVLEAGDTLMVEAAPEDLKSLIDEMGLELAGSGENIRKTLDAGDVRLMEAVVAAESPLRRKTAAELYLRRIYNVNLLAIARQGNRIWESSCQHL